MINIENEKIEILSVNQMRKEFAHKKLDENDEIYDPLDLSPPYNPVPFQDFKEECLKDPEVKKAYDDLEEEFAELDRKLAKRKRSKSKELNNE